MNVNVLSLESFIATAEKKGYMTTSVAKQTKTAVEKMKRIIEGDELTSMNLANGNVVEDVFKRFLTKFSDELTSDSANVYVSRVKKAVENAASYSANPLEYKATFGGSAPRTAPSSKKSSPSKSQPDVNKQPENGSYDSIGATFSTVFPLRKDFMLNLTLPKDLSTVEVKRMAFYLLTLCSDFNPTQSNVWQQEAPNSTQTLPGGH